jgi:hypothetical protein
LELSVALVVEYLVETLGNPATLTAGGRLCRLVAGALPVAVTTSTIASAPVTIAASALAATATMAATTVAATTVAATTLTTPTRALARCAGVGQGGAFQRLHQFETHLAPIDLADTYLEQLAVAQIILDVLDPLRAVET